MCSSICTAGALIEAPRSMWVRRQRLMDKTDTTCRAVNCCWQEAVVSGSAMRAPTEAGANGTA
eukprot:IDg9497t1